MLEGLDELFANLDALGGNVRKVSKKSLHISTKKIQAQAKFLAAVGKTGQLHNSIKTKTHETDDGVEAKVYTNVEHAVYNEFGTGQRGANEDINGNPINHRADWKGMKPQPFMSPAYLYAKNNNIVEKDFASTLQEDIKKLGSGKK